VLQPFHSTFVSCPAGVLHARLLGRIPLFCLAENKTRSGNTVDFLPVAGGSLFWKKQKNTLGFIEFRFVCVKIFLLPMGFHALVPF
jgi:hypothetical protein